MRETAPQPPPLSEVGHGEFRVAVLLARSAHQAVHQLEQAWQHPAQHDHDNERAALWHTVDIALVDIAAQHQSPTTHDTVDQWFPDPQASYDGQAALHTIPHLLPFDEIERSALINHRLHHGDNWLPEDEGSLSGTHASPALIQRWHEWLWTPNEPADAHAAPSTQGLVLAAGCSRLADALLANTAISPRLPR